MGQAVDRWWGFLRSLLIYNKPWTRLAWRRFYRQVLSPGDTVFDIGAHLGTRSRAMRAAGARVIALEPQALFARFLRRTLPRDIIFIEAAAGSSEAQARMAVSSRHPTVSSLRTDFVTGATEAPGFERVRFDASQSVQVVTLDGLIREYGSPRYIKIDVEGFEWEVLSGLSEPVPMVSLEYLPGFVHLTHTVLDRLLELGEYRFNIVAGERAQFLWPEWQGDEAVRTWLDSLSPEDRSGDLFASLDPLASAS
jgi:FkbM family methyltransferase